MGYFSWKTADTNKSIRCGENKKVYLLQPNGKEPIEEEFYEGYGFFGEVDAYEWLARNNLTKELLEKANNIIKNLNISKGISCEIRDIGIYLDDYYYIDKQTKKQYCFNELMAELFGLEKFENYSAIIRDNKTVNELIANKEFKKVCFSKLINGIKYPLKFSYNKNAKYEDLKPSKICEKQGCF
jgi:hypothetical protein